MVQMPWQLQEFRAAELSFVVPLARARRLLPTASTEPAEARAHRPSAAAGRAADAAADAAAAAAGAAASAVRQRRLVV